LRPLPHLDNHTLAMASTLKTLAAALPLSELTLTLAGKPAGLRLLV